jgi:beta-lactam-binding protein with PASTA domain
MNKAVSIALASLVLAGCGGGQSATSPSTVTVTSQSRSTVTAQATATATPVAPAPPTEITIPEVAGQNAEIVRKKLEGLGLTDVSLSSSNPKYSMVIMAANWTVVSIEPVAGTQVKSDDPVVVKVYKD